MKGHLVMTLAPKTDHTAEQGEEMYEHSCRKAGAEGCGYTIRAGSEEELKQKVIAHASKVHGVKNMTDTIYNYLRDQAKR
jgi:predicted small metal-binding protein